MGHIGFVSRSGLRGDIAHSAKHPSRRSRLSSLVECPFCSGFLALTLRLVSANEAIPSPWTVEALEGGFKVIDANRQSVAYVDGHADKCDAEIAKALTLDEADGWRATHASGGEERCFQMKGK